MSLPWFAFNVADYVTATMRLSTEAHGCYLLLMLDYYATEGPCPDDDEQLAAITRVSVEVWRERHRRVLAPLFDVRDGKWTHARIEQEIAAGHAKHEKFSQRAKTAINARWKNTTSKQQESLEVTQTQTHILSLSREDVEGKRDETEAAIAVEVPTEPERRSLTAIDMNYRPPAAVEAEILAYTEASSYHLELQKFVFHHREKGSLSEDWEASFRLWMTRFKEFSEKAAAKSRGKPRVVLNQEPEPEHQPNWDWHLSRWLNNESTWRRATAGPEPGQPGCQVPPEMFAKHGIDPATGRRKQKEQA